MEQSLIGTEESWMTRIQSALRPVRFEQMTRYRCVAAALSATAAVLIIAVVVVHSEKTEPDEIHLQASTEERQQSECRSADCFQEAATMISWMDASVEPCQNFYQHACGRFNVIHPRGEHSVYDVHQMLEDYNQKRMHDLLLEQYDNGTFFHKAATLFQSCMTAIELDRGLDDFVELTNSLGGIEMFGTWTPDGYSLQRVLTKLIQSLGVSPLFHFVLDKKLHLGISAGYTNFDLFKLSRLRNHLTELNNQSNLTEEQTLRHNIKTVLQTLPVNSSTCNNSICLDPMVDDIISVYQQTWDLDENEPCNVSMAQLSELVGEINWNSLLGETYGQRFIARTPNITISSVKYMEGIGRIINSTSTKKMQHFLIWALLERFLPVLGTKWLTIHNQLLDPFTEKHASPSEHCIEASRLSMPFSTSSLFMDTHIGSNNREGIKDLLDKAETVFLKQFNAINPDILERFGKTKLLFSQSNDTYNLPLLEKRYYKIQLNRSSFLQNFMILQNHRNTMLRQEISKDATDIAAIIALAIRDTPHTALNLKYTRDSSSFLIPYGTLQIPLYGKQLPSTINAAAMGSLIMETLFSSIFTKQSPQENWHFENIYQPFNYEVCLETSFNKINVSLLLKGIQAFAVYYLKIQRMIPASSTPVSKHFALMTSYQLHQSLQSHHTKVALPGLTSLDQDQLFFMAFVQARCQNEALPPTQPGGHAMEKTINNLMFNNAAFKQAFKCRSVPAEYRDKQPCTLD